MENEKKISSVYYDNDFDKMEKLNNRVKKLEKGSELIADTNSMIIDTIEEIKMELKAEKEIRKKAEKHIEELVNVIRKE